MLSIASGSLAMIEAANRRCAPGDEAIQSISGCYGHTGADRGSTMMAINETSQPIELLVAVDRDRSPTLGAQIEDQLRRAIRDGALRPGATLPSTRDLARQITVSRR